MCVIRLFSSRYVLMDAFKIRLFFLSMFIEINLPNLELLSFLFVLALPKASRIGLVFRIFCSKLKLWLPDDGWEEFNEERNWRLCFVVSVFPEPLSPDIQIDWSVPSSRKDYQTEAVRLHMWAGLLFKSPLIRLSFIVSRT